MMLRIVAELNGSACMRTTVRDETGSPVSMYARTTSASTCRWRFCCNAGTAVMSLESLGSLPKKHLWFSFPVPRETYSLQEARENADSLPAAGRLVAAAPRNDNEAARIFSVTITRGSVNLGARKGQAGRPNYKRQLHGHLGEEWRARGLDAPSARSNTAVTSVKRFDSLLLVVDRRAVILLAACIGCRGGHRPAFAIG